MSSLLPDPNQKKFSDGSYKGFVFHISTPTSSLPHGITSIDRTTERKLQIIERALVDGSDVKDFGRKARQVNCEVIFFGPDYVNQFNKFYAICNQGTPGKLILPDLQTALWVSVQKISDKVAANDGESLSVSVSFLEAQSTPNPNAQNGRSIASTTALSQALTIGQKITSAVAGIQSAVSNNALLQAIQSVAAQAQSLKTTANNILGLTDIGKAQFASDLNSVLSYSAFAQTILSRVQNVLNSNQTVVSSTTGNTPVNFDPVTGQAVVDYNAPTAGTTTTTASSSTQASTTTTNLPDPTFNSNAGAQTAIISLIATLQALVTSVTSGSGGRASDVASSVTVLINSLNDLLNVVTPAALVPYTVPIEMSLNEVLFTNGLSVDTVLDTYKNNTFLTDILCIPAGTVVYL